MGGPLLIQEFLWSARFSAAYSFRGCGLCSPSTTWAFGHPDFGSGPYAAGWRHASYTGFILGFKFLRARRNHHYRLTTRRLFLTTGLFQRRVDQVELVRVKDLFVRRT